MSDAASQPQKKLTAPRTPKGHSDLLPSEQIVHDQMMRTIADTHALYGFAPLTTSALQLHDVLFIKSASDGEDDKDDTQKQVFEVINGDYKVGVNDADQQVYTFKSVGDRLALRFDLTVPLAMYVARHEHDLSFPMRFSQMGWVWRGERAQAGRFRSFIQCDVDTIGSYSPIYDAEIPRVIYDIFRGFDFGPFTIRINNRKVLNGFFEALGLKEQAVEILRLVDKVDKVGRDGVFEQIVNLGIPSKTVERILSFIELSGSNDEILEQLQELNVDSALFREGVEQLAEVYGLMTGGFAIPAEYVKIDLSIARGLDYYTGTVYETILNDHPGVGSVCSGGRYDDLAGHYTKSKLPGVGISIGLTRLFYLLSKEGLIKTDVSTPASVLVLPMADNALDSTLAAATALRAAGIPTQVDFEGGKPKKQMQQANKLGVPVVAIVGERELADGTVTVKSMATQGSQQTVRLDQLVTTVKDLL